MKTVDDQDVEFNVPLALMRRIVEYLGGRPFNEVVQIMSDINQLKPLEQPTAQPISNGAQHVEERT